MLPKRRAWVGAVGMVLVAMSVGCFDNVELDTTQSGLYACTTTADCDFAVGFICLQNRCVAEVTAPEILEILPSDGSKLSPQQASELVLRATARNLTLGSEGGVGSAGMLRFFVDGELVGELRAGDAAAGVEMPLPKSLLLLPGLHHLVVKAFRSETDAFPNAGAEKGSAFWIDDGKPHVGILEPYPNRVVRVGETVTLKTGAINFSFLNSAAEIPVGHPWPTGHLHVFVNKPIPDCLAATPSCVGNYVGLIEPPGGNVTDVMFSRPVEIPEMSIKPELALAVVAQTRLHETYPNNNANEVVYDDVIVRLEPRN